MCELKAVRREIIIDKALWPSPNVSNKWQVNHHLPYKLMMDCRQSMQLRG